VPVRGELVAGPGLYEIEVLDADPRRVKRVRIYKLKERRERPRERSRAAADTAAAASPPAGVPEAASTEPKSRRP
jgi:hemolysin (HlyC) family protein